MLKERLIGRVRCRMSCGLRLGLGMSICNAGSMCTLLHSEEPSKRLHLPHAFPIFMIYCDIRSLGKGEEANHWASKQTHKLALKFY